VHRAEVALRAGVLQGGPVQLRWLRSGVPRVRAPVEAAAEGADERRAAHPQWPEVAGAVEEPQHWRPEAGPALVRSSALVVRSSELGMALVETKSF
jgi:hypothetical protein